MVSGGSTSGTRGVSVDTTWRKERPYLSSVTTRETLVSTSIFLRRVSVSGRVYVFISRTNNSTNPPLVSFVLFDLKKFFFKNFKSNFSF